MLSFHDWLIVLGAMAGAATLAFLAGFLLDRSRQKKARLTQLDRARALRAQAVPPSPSMDALPPAAGRGVVALQTRTLGSDPLRPAPVLAGEYPVHGLQDPEEAALLGGNDWTDPPQALGQPTHCTSHAQVEPLLAVQRHRARVAQARTSPAPARKGKAPAGPSSAMLAKERLRSLGLGQTRPA
jgi:hypothetical protein